MPKFGGQVAQVGQVDGSVDFSGFGSSCPRCPRCFNGGRHSAFSIEELGVVLQYWSVLISNFRIARSGRGLLATTNNETLRLTSNEQRNTRALNEWRATGFCSGFFSAGMLFICQRTLFSGSELYFGKALVPCSTRNYGLTEGQGVG